VALAKTTIYISTDSGTSWTPHGAPLFYQKAASSADGTKLLVSTYPGYIYTSTDAGANWTQRGPSQYWEQLTSSADGTKLAAAGSSNNGSFIYTSSGPVP
jgi:photosystem II stability/assembly factor-like uncharacterized protein